MQKRCHLSEIEHIIRNEQLLNAKQIKNHVIKIKFALTTKIVSIYMQDNKNMRTIYARGYMP